MEILLGNKYKITLFILFVLLLPMVSFAKYEGERGYCALCDTKIFSPKEEGSFYLVPNKEYTEVWFEFSNASKGKVGFCRKHAKSLRKSNYPKIMEGIRHAWEKEFELNNWSKEQIEEYKKNFFNLTIIRKLSDEEVNNFNK